MGTDKVAFAEVLCGGATGSHVTGNHVTGSGPEPEVTSVTPEVCSAHAQPEVAQYPP